MGISWKGRLALALLAVIKAEDTSYIWNGGYSGYGRGVWRDFDGLPNSD